MKTYQNIILGTLSFILSYHYASAQTIARWTFETSPPADLNNSSTIGGLLADQGLGTASAFHSSVTTDWSTPAGNGSVNSLSANEWSLNDYFQFSVSTVGYQGISVSWAHTSSSTGPGEFKLAYQVNGGGFVDFLNYTVLPNSATLPGLGTWNSVTEIPGYNYYVDLSALTILDNATSVDFRLIMRSTADSTPPGTVALTGTSRIDNFAVLAPEPSAVALVSLGLAALAFRRRK